MKVMTKLHITDDPWSLVAFGALAGVWLASLSKPKVSEGSGALMGIIGALALRFVRNVAMHEMTRLAKGFVATPTPPPAHPYAS